MPSYDVIVVGAGPAGAILSYELSREGMSVLLLEKEKLPRYKCCAGGVTAHCAALLDLDASDTVEDTIYSAGVTYKFKDEYVGRSERPLAYMVMRSNFDNLLVEKAREKGTTIIDECRVMGLRMEDDGVTVMAERGRFHARVVAGADGPYSAVARSLGIRVGTDGGPSTAAIEAEVAISAAEMEKHRATVSLDLGCIPGDYAWTFPKREHLSIGIGCSSPQSKKLKRQFGKFLATQRLGDYAITKFSGHLMPIRGVKSPLQQGRVLLLGDAAGLIDPLSGEGIYYAIWSAHLAAPVIRNFLDSSPGDDIDLRDYALRVESEIMPELEAAYLASRIFKRFPFLTFKALQKDERVWRGCTRLICGETSYSAIRKSLGGWGKIAALLSRGKR